MIRPTTQEGIRNAEISCKKGSIAANGIEVRTANNLTLL
jgi:hypothetical protein